MDYNDYELVYLAKEGNEDAINIIYKKYLPIIINKSKNSILYVSHHGIEINDIIQEGLIALDVAIRNFVQDDSATFFTFANLCIDRKIFNYIRRIIKGKNKILNDALSIDLRLADTVRDDLDIETSFIDRDNERELVDRIYNKLTSFERQVFDFRMEGYSFLEIANLLNKDAKSIYNTCHRIKQKCKKIIDGVE